MMIADSSQHLGASWRYLYSLLDIISKHIVINESKHPSGHDYCPREDSTLHVAGALKAPDRSGRKWGTRGTSPFGQGKCDSCIKTDAKCPRKHLVVLIDVQTYLITQILLDEKTLLLTLTQDGSEVNRDNVLQDLTDKLRNDLLHVLQDIATSIQRYSYRCVVQHVTFEYVNRNWFPVQLLPFMRNALFVQASERLKTITSITNQYMLGMYDVLFGSQVQGIIMNIIHDFGSNQALLSEICPNMNVSVRFRQLPIVGSSLCPLSPIVTECLHQFHNQCDIIIPFVDNAALLSMMLSIDSSFMNHVIIICNPIESITTALMVPLEVCIISLLKELEMTSVTDLVFATMIAGHTTYLPPLAPFTNSLESLFQACKLYNKYISSKAECRNMQTMITEENELMRACLLAPSIRRGYMDKVNNIADAIHQGNDWRHVYYKQMVNLDMYNVDDICSKYLDVIFVVLNTSESEEYYPYAFGPSLHHFSHYYQEKTDGLDIGKTKSMCAFTWDSKPNLNACQAVFRIPAIQHALVQPPCINMVFFQQRSSTGKISCSGQIKFTLSAFYLSDVSEPVSQLHNILSTDINYGLVHLYPHMYATQSYPGCHFVSATIPPLCKEVLLQSRLSSFKV